MYKFFSLCIVMIIGCVCTASANFDHKAIMQIYTYDVDHIRGGYEIIGAGSSVYIGNGRILTNAHVILDEENTPTDYYEVCKVDDIGRPTSCFSTAHFLAYDIDTDLALLQLDQEVTGITPISFADLTPELADDVLIYGFPENGGQTLTLTQGKISGFERRWYKIDANMDAGNSGGGGFDADGNFIGMPTFVVEGYTTLGYLIPTSTVKDFLESIDIAHSSDLVSFAPGNTSPDFSSFVEKMNMYIGANELHTPYFHLDNYQEAGFEVVYAYENKEADIGYYILWHIDHEVMIYININKQSSTSFMQERLENTQEELAYYFDDSSYRVESHADTKWFYSEDLRGTQGFLSYIELNDMEKYLSYTIYYENEYQEAIDAAKELFSSHLSLVYDHNTSSGTQEGAGSDTSTISVGDVTFTYDPTYVSFLSYINELGVNQTSIVTPQGNISPDNVFVYSMSYDKGKAGRMSYEQFQKQLLETIEHEWEFDPEGWLLVENKAGEAMYLFEMDEQVLEPGRNGYIIVMAVMQEETIDIYVMEFYYKIGTPGQKHMLEMIDSLSIEGKNALIEAGGTTVGSVRQMVGGTISRFTQLLDIVMTWIGQVFGHINT